MRGLMLAGTAVAALGGTEALADVKTEAAPAAATTQTPAAMPDNILLKDWSGPYGGVPPFDKVTPAMFPHASRWPSAVSVAGCAPRTADSVTAYFRHSPR